MVHCKSDRDSNVAADFHNRDAGAIAERCREARQNQLNRAHCRWRQKLPWRRTMATIRMQTQVFCSDLRRFMASLDQVSIAILLGSVLVMAGILSSLLALRFGAPLLLVFLLIGMLAGDSGPGQLRFDDVRTTYLVGSVALALILFDGGLRTRLQSIRAVLAPSMVLAPIGVLLTALITAPVARYALDLNWPERLVVGAGAASADGAAGCCLAPSQLRS